MQRLSTRADLYERSRQFGASQWGVEEEAVLSPLAASNHCRRSDIHTCPVDWVTCSML